MALYPSFRRARNQPFLGLIINHHLKWWLLTYVDDDTAREIEKLIRQVDEKLRKTENIHLQAGDIHPSEVAPVIAADHKDLCCKWQRWGFPGFSGK